MGEIISLIGVNKSFGKKDVLKNINFSINTGDIIGLVGKSGSGKSILIKTIIGFLKPDSGDIILTNPEKKINFSMQGNSIYDYLTVKQNFVYFAKMYGLKRKERKKVIEEIINELDLKDFEDVIVKNLSGGTQKRVDIGCALLNDPELIVMDEPFLGLDPELVNKLGATIIRLNRAGKTLLISSHDIGILGKICKQFASIRNGNLSLIKKEQIGYSYTK